MKLQGIENIDQEISNEIELLNKNKQKNEFCYTWTGILKANQTCAETQ